MLRSGLRRLKEWALRHAGVRRLEARQEAHQLALGDLAAELRQFANRLDRVSAEQHEVTSVQLHALRAQARDLWAEIRAATEVLLRRLDVCDEHGLIQAESTRQEVHIAAESAKQHLSEH